MSVTNSVGKGYPARRELTRQAPSSSGPPNRSKTQGPSPRTLPSPVETDEAGTPELGIPTEPIEDPTSRGASRATSTTGTPTTRELRTDVASTPRPENASGVTTSTVSSNPNKDDESDQKSKDQVPKSMSVTNSVRKVNPVRRELTWQAPLDSRSPDRSRIQGPSPCEPNQKSKDQDPESMSVTNSVRKGYPARRELTRQAPSSSGPPNRSKIQGPSPRTLPSPVETDEAGTPELGIPTEPIGDPTSRGASRVTSTTGTPTTRELRTDVASTPRPENASGVITSTVSSNPNKDDESDQKSKDQVPKSMSVTNSVRKVYPVRRELTWQAPSDSRSPDRSRIQGPSPRTLPNPVKTGEASTLELGIPTEPIGDPTSRGTPTGTSTTEAPTTRELRESEDQVSEPTSLTNSVGRRYPVQRDPRRQVPSNSESSYQSVQLQPDEGPSGEITSTVSLNPNKDGEPDQKSEDQAPESNERNKLSEEGRPSPERTDVASTFKLGIPEPIEDPRTKPSNATQSSGN